MLRRKFATLLLGASALTACATLSSDVSSAVEKFTLVANSISQAAAGLGALGTIPQNVADQVRTWAGRLTDLASQASSALLKSAAQDAVSQGEAVLQSIITALTPWALPAPVPMVLAAASVLIPIIRGLLGMVVHPTAMPTSMTGSQAELYLRSYVRR